MVGHDGVVVAGAGGAEDLDAAVGGAGGAAEDGDEFVEGEEAGAGAGDEKAAGFDAGDGEFVEVEIFGAAFREFFLGVDELGGVEDDDVVLLLILNELAEVGEGVGVGGVEGFLVDLVEVGVALGEGDGVFVEVDAGDVVGLAEGGGVDAEAAGVGAEVEDVFAFGEFGEVEAVVALVGEEAGLVAVGEVDLEADAVLGDDGGFAVGGAVFLGAGGGVLSEDEAFVVLNALVGADKDVFDLEEFFEFGSDGFGAAEHGEVEEFDDGEVAEAVDDEAGEGIAFCVDDAVGVGGGVEAELIDAEIDRGGEALGDEGFVDGGGIEGEHAETDGGLGGEHAGAEPCAFAVVYSNEVAVSGFRGDAADHFAEDGRVEDGVAELDPGERAGVFDGGHAAEGFFGVGALGGAHRRARGGGAEGRTWGALVHGSFLS